MGRLRRLRCQQSCPQHVTRGPRAPIFKIHDRHPRRARNHRRHPAPADPGRTGGAALHRRRLGLHLPRLPRAAAADPQDRRAAGRGGLRLLQHAVEADGRHEGRARCADPPGGGVRQVRGHLPQPALRRVQGAPAAAAGRPRPAVPAGARGDTRVRRALPGDRRLRGRRHHRRLRLPGARRRRRGGDRLLRQGPDAAGGPAGLDAGHHEERPHRHSGGDGEVRGAAGEGDRRAGAVRRLASTTCLARPASASRPPRR